MPESSSSILVSSDQRTFSHGVAVEKFHLLQTFMALIVYFNDLNVCLFLYPLPDICNYMTAVSSIVKCHVYVMLPRNRKV